MLLADGVVIVPREIDSIEGLLAAIEETGFYDQRHDHVRIWFRGHGDRSWSLAPGACRPGFAPDPDSGLLKERHLTQDFQALGAPFLRGVERDVDIYFLQQHYRMETRLLDWSLNPLAALFFALDPLDTKLDGTFFMLDAYRMAGKRGFCTSRADEIRKAMRAIFEWVDVDEGGASPWPDRILAVRPFNIDPRLAAQRGCFTFHPPTHAALDPAHEALRSFRIPAAAKEGLRRKLDILGFDEFTTYGGLDHLARRLRRNRY